MAGSLKEPREFPLRRETRMLIDGRDGAVEGEICEWRGKEDELRNSPFGIG